MTCLLPTSNLVSFQKNLRNFFVVSVLIFTLVPSALLAQDISPQEARARIKKLQAALQSVYASVPLSYGDNLSVEAAQLDSALKQLDALEQAIIPAFSKAPQTLEAFERNISKTRAFVAGSRRAYLCAQAVGDIIDSHSAGIPASEAQMQAVQKALSSLNADPVGFEPVAAWCEEKMVALVKERVLVVKEQEANLADAQKAKLARELQEKLKMAVKSLKLAKQDLDAALAASSVALSKEVLSEMRAAANRIFSVDEKSGTIALAEVQFYEAELAWRQSQNEGVAVIAGAMNADVATLGKAKGQKVRFAFKAKAGRCYAALMRFKTYTGDQKIDSFKFISGKKGSRGLQRFTLDNRSATFQMGEGFCATEDVRLKASGKIFAGRSNVLKYVVLSWAKEKIPPNVLASISMSMPDRCATQIHKSLWLNPVPGTLAYIEDQPYLIIGSSPSLDLPSKLVDFAGQKREVVTGALRAAPNAPLTAKIPFIFRGCSRDGVDGPHRGRYNRCLAKANKRYARRLKKAKRRVRTAKSDSRLEKAEAALAKVLEQIEEREDKKCGKIEEKILGEVRDLHELLVQRFAGPPQAVLFDRGEYLKARAVLGL